MHGKHYFSRIKIRITIDWKGLRIKIPRSVGLSLMCREAASKPEWTMEPRMECGGATLKSERSRRRRCKCRSLLSMGGQSLMVTEVGLRSYGV